jgi:Mn2+/Fe2+ NRAMP family transporter
MALTPHEETRLLQDAQSQPIGSRFRLYAKLSGPGWLQSAITLGGGSLSGSLYLGVVGGVGMLWLQPLAMLIGIVMLSAIAYVTVSTGQRPFAAINRSVNPVLGWGWAVAALVASMVWAMPQYTLSLGVLRQNLFPQLLAPTGPLGELGSRLIPTLLILAVAIAVTWQYGRGGAGVKWYERSLKVMVALIVLCFAGVFLRLVLSPQGLEWGALLQGFMPDFSYAFRPAPALQALIDATPAAHRAHWTKLIVANQRDVMVAATAAAVGINMTFLFPYTLLRRGWGKHHFGLIRFDLLTGMLIPFTLATSFVVIAAASQFHAAPQPGILISDTSPANARQIGEYEKLLAGLGQSGASLAASEADRALAATLVTRDAFDLARALEPFTGPFFARFIFGIGVLGMTLSTITILMLISGFVICEMLGREHNGWPLRIGCLAAASGALGPFVWNHASFYLAVPASIFGLILIPIAYFTFFLLMNQRKLLGAHLPTGRSRLIWNGLMILSLAVVTPASLYMLWNKGGMWGMLVAGIFLAAAAVVHVLRAKEAKATAADPLEAKREALRETSRR